MPYYNYKARDQKGKSVASQTFATNKEGLIKQLQKNGLLVISVKESASVEELHHGKMHKNIKNEDLIFFVKQLTVMIENGVPILSAFEIVSKQIESSGLLKVTTKIRNDLESGSTLKDAIAKHPKVFKNFWVDMIEAGELSGKLPYVLNQIALFLLARDKIRKETVNAFMYPAMLFTLAIVTVVVFITKVVPIFEELSLIF